MILYSLKNVLNHMKIDNKINLVLKKMFVQSQNEFWSTGCQCPFYKFLGNFNFNFQEDLVKTQDDSL